MPGLAAVFLLMNSRFSSDGPIPGMNDCCGGMVRLPQNRPTPPWLVRVVPAISVPILAIRLVGNDQPAPKMVAADLLQ